MILQVLYIEKIYIILYLTICVYDIINRNECNIKLGVKFMSYKFLRLKIFQKTILVFLTIMIPVYFISIYINISSMNIMKRETCSSMASQVQFYSKNFGDEIGNIKLQQWQLLNTQDILKLSVYSQTMGFYDTVKLIDNIKERLITIRNSSNYIKDVGIYLKSFGKIITTESGLKDSEQLEFEMLRQYFSNGVKEPVFIYNGRLFLIEPFTKNAINPHSDLIDVIYIELSISAIKDALRALNVNKDSGGVLLINNKKNFTISVQNDNLDANSIDKLLKDCTVTGNNYFVSTINKKSYWLAYDDIKYLNMKLVLYVPENQITFELKKYDLGLLFFSLISIVSIVIFALFINYMIHRPMGKIINAFKELEAENLEVSIKHNGYDEFSYIYNSFNHMVVRLKQSIEDVYEQKIANQQSELKQLQSQINPHFLYNSFFHIYRMCKFEDFENVGNFTQKLGNYYQFITRNGSSEVPVHMEVSHAKDYVEIQSMRFSNRINAEFSELQQDCKTLLVPRLILQPIIENAYEHGFENSIEGGTIYINTCFQDNILRVTIEDSGSGMKNEDLIRLQEKLTDTSSAVEKTGIVNVSRRLKLRYGNGSGLFALQSEFGGLRIDLIINFSGGEINA